MVFPEAVLSKVKSINLQTDVYSAMLGVRTTRRLCNCLEMRIWTLPSVQFHGFLVSSKTVCLSNSIQSKQGSDYYSRWLIPNLCAQCSLGTRD